jgi:serine/threonine protein kinase
MSSDPENLPEENGASDGGRSGAMPSIMGGMSPDELFARGMQSVRMTGGGSLQSWEPPSVEEAERLFPNYDITEMIGRGGMGVVYKGRQTALDRVVAIKLLPLEVSIDRDFSERFVREARTMARMNHPNIVSVFDFGKTTEGHLYFVMEFVEGTTLHHLIKAVGLKPAQAMELIVGVCDALHYAHSEGVIHRDIKPANILVDTRGRVKVTDFGLARMDAAKTPEQWGQTMTGMILGTPDYMAPEQKKGLRVDHRADIYSLGVMLYEMLCGEIPAGVFDPPSQRVPVDERIDQVVIRAMQQEPDRRYSNTDEMKSAVETIRTTPLPQKPSATAVLPEKTAAAAAAPAPSTQIYPAQKSHGPVLTYVAAGCAVLAVGVVAWKELRPAPVVPQKADGVKVVEATPAPAPIPKPETSTPKPEVLVASATPAPAPMASASTPAPVEKPTEPVAPVPAPPQEKPVAVATVTIPAQPKPAQGQTQNNNARITPVAPVPQYVPPPATGVMPREATAPVVGNDFKALVAQGDGFMKRRQTEDAIEAYSRAIEVAEDNPRSVPPSEFGQICLRLGTLQISNGSAAEARQTLIGGRNFLINAKAPRGTVDQIESVLKRLPRE